MATAIPLRNIWLLFLYAADLVQFKGRFDNQVETARDLPDLVARLLTHVVEERLRRNLSRGYRPRVATLSRVRGRIDMLETTTRRLMDRGRIACRFEEHTMDTPRNRLVRAALAQLATRVADDLVAHRCRQLAGDFTRMGVVGPRPSWAELASDQIGRNEATDRFMVALARMVFDTIIPMEEPGEVSGALPDSTDHLIRRLFERAVGNALRLELQPQGWSVTQGKRLSWPVTAASPGIAEILPGMQTDIELNHATTGHRIVIDTKFTAIFTASSYRDRILKSGYLYQLYTYLRSQERLDDSASLTAVGMLLHPQTGGAVDEEATIQGHRMRFKTVDLACDPGEFEMSLRGLVSE
ncbi:5-methylcytosine-specific restriction endonuclease system specificity protein McrC [Phaeobacter sp. SYSU ZJ3003]|uniref:5-methylcytosine-specific restriction endonuclease system specificity protein McrC n=1 Tax=Phaeobacter sp. SYSU ZJ3003 TaxID=2109330 RepID=UPI00351C7E09